LLALSNVKFHQNLKTEHDNLPEPKHGAHILTLIANIKFYELCSARVEIYSVYTCTLTTGIFKL